MIRELDRMGSSLRGVIRDRQRDSADSMPPASDTTIPKAQFGNLNIVIESSSQYIIRSYAELFIINAGGYTHTSVAI